jgi:hypothetical protein
VLSVFNFTLNHSFTVAGFIDSLLSEKRSALVPTEARTTRLRTQSYQDQMGHLSFPLDAELTGPDRLVLSVLQKQYEAHVETTDLKNQDAAEDSDDSATKHSEFVAPSPEGNAYFSYTLDSLPQTASGNAMCVVLTAL